MTIAEERRKEGYAIAELHAIVEITERQLHDTVVRVCPDEAACNAHPALLDVIMDAARMVLSVTYVLSAQDRPARRRVEWGKVA